MRSFWAEAFYEYDLGIYTLYIHEGEAHQPPFPTQLQFKVTNCKKSDFFLIFRTHFEMNWEKLSRDNLLKGGKAGPYFSVSFFSGMFSTAAVAALLFTLLYFALLNFVLIYFPLLCFALLPFALLCIPLLCLLLEYFF